MSYTREEVEAEFQLAQRMHLTWTGGMPAHIYRVMFIDRHDMHIFQTNPDFCPQTRAERLAKKRECEARRDARRLKPARFCFTCKCYLVPKVGKPAKYCPQCRANSKLKGCSTPTSSMASLPPEASRTY